MADQLSPGAMLAPSSSAAMRGVLADRARLQHMLDFEVALARAQAAVGVIPVSAVEPIANAARAERVDLSGLEEAAISAGNIVAPLIEALTAEVSKSDAKAAQFVHWGASAEDAIDTALVLDLKAAVEALTSE